MGSTVIASNDIVERVLAKYATQLGEHFDGYRNHVMRSLNYYALLSDGEVSDDAALAWAVHDLGIWSAGTFDYLDPSAALARDLAPEFGIADSGHAEQLVLGHHHLLPFADKDLEAFRRADLTDFSRGIIRNGLSLKQIREVSGVFPNAGFHRFLASGLVRNIVHHPLNPLPMVRLR